MDTGRNGQDGPSAAPNVGAVILQELDHVEILHQNTAVETVAWI